MIRTSRRVSLRTVGAVIAVLAVLGGVFLSATPTAAAQGDLRFIAEIDGRDITSGTNTSPIPLHPDRDLVVDLAVENTSGSDLVLGYVRLQGSAIGIDFMTVDTTVRLPVAAGEQRTFQIPFEFFDLEDQATGLIRGSMVLFDEDRTELGTASFIADVRGSIFSGLGVFSAAVLAFAIISICFNTHLAYNRRLHKDRLIRGLQFAFTGLALGLLLGLGLSILRITATAPAASLLAVIIPTLIAFGVGYLTPNRLSSWYLWEEQMIEREWIDLEDELREAAQPASDPNATIVAE